MSGIGGRFQYGVGVCVGGKGEGLGVKQEYVWVNTGEDLDVE